VLEKLGFAPTGIVGPRYCCARGEQVAARMLRLRLRSDIARPVEPSALEAA
jgi:hypothetical protein